MLGALSSLGLTSLMEVGDSLSGKYGFSYEDAIMNVAGAGLGYLLWRKPALARWVDLRVEWEPNARTEDLFTDYENLKYLVAFKLDAARSLRDTPLRFLELQTGYYVRGYSDLNPSARERNLYFGIALNVSRLVRKAGFPRLSRAFNDIQVPHTYVSLRNDLND